MTPAEQFIRLQARAEQAEAARDAAEQQATTYKAEVDRLKHIEATMRDGTVSNAVHERHLAIEQGWRQQAESRATALEAVLREALSVGNSGANGWAMWVVLTNALAPNRTEATVSSEHERDALLDYLQATRDEDGVHHRDWVADCQQAEAERDRLREALVEVRQAVSHPLMSRDISADARAAVLPVIDAALQGAPR